MTPALRSEMNDDVMDTSETARALSRCPVGTTEVRSPVSFVRKLLSPEILAARDDLPCVGGVHLARLAGGTPAPHWVAGEAGATGLACLADRPSPSDESLGYSHEAPTGHNRRPRKYSTRPEGATPAPRTRPHNSTAVAAPGPAAPRSLMVTCLAAALAFSVHVALAAGIARAATSPPEQRFAEAQAIFDAAKQTMETGGADSVEARRQFHEAATRFAAIARAGTITRNLCVNAGNAYHFAGDEPRALLWYLKGMQLTNTPETRNGVATLRRTCGAELWPPEPASIGRALMSWHYDVSRRTKQRILFATYPLGCALVIASLFARRRSLWLRLGLVLICLGAAMGVSDVAAGLAPANRWAVIVEGGKGYAGDGESYSVVINALAPGQEVKLFETRPEWAHVALPGGTTCWVHIGICEEV